MNDHGLDIFVAVFQTICLAMVIGPVCWLIYASDRERRLHLAPRQRSAHLPLYLGVIVAFLLIP